MAIRSVITELVRKECESYQLVELGFLSSVEDGVNRLLPAIETADTAVLGDFSRFCIWRQEVLRLFYRQLGYADCVRFAADGSPFRYFWLGMRKRIVAALHRQSKEPTIDRELAVSGKTLAFKLSGMLDDELFSKDRPSVWLAVDTPAMLEEIYREHCRGFFPIDMEKLMARLKVNDAEFWDDLFLTVKKIARIVTSGQSVSLQYRKEVLQDVWADTCLLLNQKVVAGDTPDFETSSHFHNYIARVCSNKCRETVRKYHLPDVALTVTGEVPGETVLSEERMDEESDLFGKGGLEDIDCNNEDEVNRNLVVILWDKLEPWYSDLTRGIEEKMTLIFSHYVEGLSYEEMARMKDQEGTVEARSRLAGKLRQDVVRTRRLLRRRFVELLKGK